MKSVFISSTFKDMQAERDYLHEKVFTRLRKLAGQYGEDIQELDLRWGVDTYQMSEEESGYQVLRVCIDAIDRCKPYIIVLLGDRYGWIPDAKLVGSMRDTRLEQQYEASMSITNLEIKYGALSEEETLKRCIFCFRDPGFAKMVPEELRAVYLAESPEHEKKLRILKEQIRGKKDAKIIDYQVKWDEEHQIVSGLGQLGEDIYHLLEEQLRKDLAGREAKSPIQQYILDARGTKERYLASYTPRLYEERKAVEAMNFMAGDAESLYHSKYKAWSKKWQCLHLTGPAGCGKSALMAAIEQQASDAGAETILYFSGNPGCQSVETLKSVIIYRLEEILGIPHDEACENKNSYLRILNEKVKGKLIYCFIDALDQLFADQQNLYLEIIGLCPDLYVVTSALDTFPYRKSLLGAVHINVVEVRRFMEEEKKALIQMTGTYRGKTIDDVLKEKICAKESSDNPLFLSLILQRLFAMRKAEFEQAESLAPGMDGLHLYMERLIAEVPEKVTEASVRLFEHVEEMFGSTFLKDVCYLIALSETGLAEREIGEILKQQSIEFSQLRFQEILYYLYDVFTENADGKWVYSHRIFKEAMRQEAEYKENIIRGYFIRYSEDDPEFLMREGYYHILKSKDEKGKEILRKCHSWTTFGRVKNLVKRMLLEGEAAETYFLGMLEDTGLEELFGFWKSVDSPREENQIKTFLKKIYKTCAGKEELPVKLRIEALYGMGMIGMIGQDTLEDSIAQVCAARSLLPEIMDEENRKLWEIKIDYLDAWNLMDTGKEEEGLALIKSALEEVEGLLPDTESAEYVNDGSCQEHWQKREEAIYFATLLGRVYLIQSRRRFKRRFPQYLESVLVLYDRYSEYMRTRKFQIAKIILYMEGAFQYSGSSPERSKQYAGKAVELARSLSDEEPDAEVLELLARSLNCYGHDGDREHRYQYRYEALEVYKRIFQMEQTDYWKLEVAAQAAFFAKDISSLVQELKLDDRDGWIVKGREAWRLCFSYYEELLKKGYEYASRADYADSLLTCATGEVFMYYTDDAVSHAKTACDCLREGRKNGWEPESQREMFRCWNANALAAENLDDRLCANEAIPYAYEAVEWAKRLYAKKVSQQNLIYVLVSLQVAARVLYHADRDDEASAIVKEAEKALDYHQKEYQQRMPSAEYEIRYIAARLSLKKQDAENARRYTELLKEYEEGGQLDFWQKGQMLLLKGDLLFAEEAYAEAKEIYYKSFRHWKGYHEEVKQNIRTTIGFRLRDGEITRDTSKRLWHVKTFYYYLYTVFQKAETTYKGELWGKYYTPALEYSDLYKRCMEGVKVEEYRPVAETFMLRAMDRMIEFGKEAKWSGIGEQETLSFLCQMIGYGKEKNLNMDRQYEALADAFCHYDLFMLPLVIAFSKETANCWVDIYQYLKQKNEEGMDILPCNRYLIGYMWMKMGCYEEARLWLDAVSEEEKRYNEARLGSLLCRAMCALHDKEEGVLSEVMAEITDSKRNGSEGWDNMFRDLYRELTGSVSDILEKTPKDFHLQEKAQRYLNVLKNTADQGVYPSLSDKAKENFWSVAKEIRGAYYEWNERIPGREDIPDRWEDRAAAMKDLTAGGMTWQVGYAEFEEELYTTLRRIYETYADKEEKQKIADRIVRFWREEYEKTDLKRLSLENLQLLRETEQVTGRALFPLLEEELALRLDDKGILHEYFRKLPEYSRMDDWKELPRPRKMEIKDIFDRLLEQDTEEWADDFKRWISEEMWIVGHMECFKEPETLDMPQKHLLYEVYCQYQIEFRESSRERWIGHIRECKG